MKKFFKRLLIILLVFLVLLIGGISLIASFFEEQVGRTLTSSINEQLTSELTIEEFELTVIRSFPSLSANFIGVNLGDSRGDTLLQAERIAFRMGLLSLLKSSLEIKSVIVSDGRLRIEIDDQGVPNYAILKPAEEEPPGARGGGPSVDLTRARLENISLTYTDQSSQQDIRALVEAATFSGAFADEQFSLNSEAVLESSYVDIDGVRYLPGKAINYEAEIAVDLNEQVYELQRVEVAIGGNAFQLDGAVEQWEAGTYMDLYATAENGNLAGVLALLPADYAAALEGFSSDGQFAFNAIVKGQANARQNPEVRVEFSLDEGRLKSDLLENPLKDVSFNAVFTNGKYRDATSSSFTVERFKGYFNRELVEMRLHVSNLEDPSLDFNLDGVLPLQSAYGLLGNPKIEGGSGEMEFKNIQVAGQYKDMINPSRISRVQASGAVEFDDAGLSIGEESVVLDRGELRLEGNRLYINDVRLEGAGSDIAFQGAAFNLLPVLFADSTNSKRVQLEFSAALNAESLDIDRLLAFSALTEEEAAAEAPVRDSLAQANLESRSLFLSFLDGTFNANIEAFNYEKIEGRNFIGKLTFDEARMSILGEVEAFDGQIDLDGEASLGPAPQLNAKMTCESIDVSTFFEQTGNFGQEVLTHNNLEGRLDTKMAIYAYWDEQGHFQMDKLRVLAGIGIKDGELKDFAMLEDFSTFVDVRDLRRIKFVNMQNFLEIQNRRLYLPVMFIRSNALNLTISGEHSFDQEIAYHIKVNAGQVIANRFQEHDPALKPKPAKQSGWFNLYYAILGTLEDYNITAAKKRVKSDFELSEVRKRDIRRALEQEFGIVELIEEPESWKDIPEFNHDTYDPEAEEYLDFEVGGR